MNLKASCYFVVEGFEVEALKGAKELFNRNLVRSTLVELTPQLLEPDVKPLQGSEWPDINGKGSKALIEVLNHLVYKTVITFHLASKQGL